jgi:predicted secreted Zn-dependent protease
MSRRKPQQRQRRFPLSHLKKTTLLGSLGLACSLVAIAASPPAIDFTGMWKSDCSDNFGFQIKSAGGNLYSVSFCGPGGCFLPGTYRPNTSIIGDPLYEQVTPSKLRLKQADGTFTLATKCSDNPTPKNSKILNDPAIKGPGSTNTDLAFASTEAGRKLIADFAIVAVQHYEIRGATVQDLNIEMRAKGHGGEGASMSSKVKYDFKCQSSDGDNAIRSISSTCFANLRLPKWYGIDSASPQMKETWKAYYDKVKTHEMGHVAICASSAKSVREALESIPNAANCSAIYKLASARAETIIGNMRKRNQQYDTDSHNGN